MTKPLTKPFEKLTYVDMQAIGARARAEQSRAVGNVVVAAMRAISARLIVTAHRGKSRQPSPHGAC